MSLTNHTMVGFDKSLKKPKAPKPPKSHAAHRTIPHQKTAGSKRRKPKYNWSLRKKRRMGLWSV